MELALPPPGHIQLDVRERVITVTLVEHPERKNPLSFESFFDRLVEPAALQHEAHPRQAPVFHGD